MSRKALAVIDSIEIGGCKISIKSGKGGGEVSLDKGLITINPTFSPDNQEEYLVHEIAEGCMISLRLRFTNSDDSIKFILSHDEFSAFSTLLYTALKPHLKLRKEQPPCVSTLPEGQS